MATTDAVYGENMYEQLVDEQTKYGPESDAEVGVRATALESQPVPKMAMVQETTYERGTLRHVPIVDLHY